MHTAPPPPPQQTLPQTLPQTLRDPVNARLATLYPG